jgi:hypothetical protein
MQLDLPKPSLRSLDYDCIFNNRFDRSSTASFLTHSSDFFFCRFAILPGGERRERGALAEVDAEGAFITYVGEGYFQFV